MYSHSLARSLSPSNENDIVGGC